jgi:DNA-binding NarL/FixJ family response regulator
VTSRYQVALRDRVIVSLVAQGMSNREIAEEVGFSRETVRLRLTTIYARNEISEGRGGKNRRELARRYMLGLIDQQ